MLNRIKEFRLKKGLTQKECVKSFNKYLNNENIKGITTATFSRWENGKNSPTEKMWNSLASYFKTTATVLKGAIGLEEVLKIIQNDYIDTCNGKPHKSFLIASTDDYLAGIGKISPKKNTLSKKEAYNFEFWRKYFSDIFLFGQPVLWLITTKPVNLDLYSAETLITLALDLTIKQFKGTYKNFASNIKKYEDFLLDRPVQRSKSDSKKIPRETKEFDINNYEGITTASIQMFEVKYPNPEEREKNVQEIMNGVDKIFQEARKKMNSEKKK